ncbi:MULTISPECIES: aldo/keto reductase family oxidoreductase [unclassified Lentimicrobium]|uniref:aldo/keto reductase n=1 Tax=unclassified Lentimicrobium TaxID=2677434 RepID=UPI0015555E9C|nr:MULTISPECIES: aldo/keto reductase [unclassified Lentimicrobium]NPD46811.1 aldo/keto reductase [Lentimicrobium sp. S6]NPD85614.1 aldo/keto reductase [Lentimicrobium sp. L6]
MTKEQLKLSPIVHGHWRLADWKLSPQELLTLTEQCIELGITSFDHADIYGNYSCEALFGDALKLKPELRENIQIISKCGIKLNSDKFPERKLKVYDYSYDYIMDSVHQSLKNLNTKHLDLLLLHRPAPFFQPEEAAKAFSELKAQGKVRQFGVSNFSILQFEMLQKYCDMDLVSNQVEISPYCLEHFENGNMDFFVKEKIQPMAWSPLAGGMLFNPSNPKSVNVRQALIQVAMELQIASIDVIAYAWLMKHPAQVIPIVGSGKLRRIKTAVEAQSIEMNMEQWYRIYIAAYGEELP